MKGLLLLGGGKSKGEAAPEMGDDETEESEDSSGGVEEDYAREAYAAVKSGDEQGFVDSFLGAVRACSAKAKSGDYEDNEEDSDDAA